MLVGFSALAITGVVIGRGTMTDDRGCDGVKGGGAEG